MKTRHLFEVSLLCLLGLLYACVHDPTIEEQRSNTHNDLLTVSAAREFVEKQLSLKTRAHTTKTKGLEPGDFSPLWNEAKMSQNAKVGSVDVPIIPQYNYYALRCEEKNGKIKVHKVRISQKVVVIKAKDNGRLSSYLLTLIPDGDYYAKNKNKFDEFFNSGSHNFSGVVVYYDIHARHTVRVNKYVKGHKTAGIYLMCNSKDWDKRVKIAKKILGPIRIAKSANKMTRSFDEDDEMEPCWICGDPWCYGDCDDDDDTLYCWNCGSSWCNGDCDDDPVIITPDYCSGCGEYEFNCTCNVCSWCGSDPCTCDDTCSWCGNDPCTCGVCPDCGDDPCTCEEWECPKCGDPYCSGGCGSEKEEPGKDTTDNNDGNLEAALNNLKTQNTPKKLLQNVTLDRIEVRKAPAGSEGKYGGCTPDGTIYVYDITPTHMCEIVLLEELVHRYQLSNPIHGEFKGNVEIEAKLLLWDYLIEKYSTASNVQANLGYAWTMFGIFAENPCEETWPQAVDAIGRMGYSGFKTSDYSHFRNDNYQSLK